MGGETVLRGLRGMEVSGISVLHQREQSERPEGPWIPNFTEFTDVRNLSAGAVKRTSRTRGDVTEDGVAWAPDTSILIIDGVGIRTASDRFAAAGTPWDMGRMSLQRL